MVGLRRKSARDASRCDALRNGASYAACGTIVDAALLFANQSTAIVEYLKQPRKGMMAEFMKEKLKIGCEEKPT